MQRKHIFNLSNIKPAIDSKAPRTIKNIKNFKMSQKTKYENRKKKNKFLFHFFFFQLKKFYYFFKKIKRKNKAN